MYVRDSRTLMGAISMLLSGGVLTSMIQLYFAGEASGEGLVTSRWWWEIVMNLQVASIACMWFCFVDKISDAEGPRKAILRFRLVGNVLIILLPVWLALIGAQFNWFVERPPLYFIDYLITVMLTFGLTVSLVSRFYILDQHPDAYGGKKFWFIPGLVEYIYWAPLMVAAAIWLFEQFNGGTLHYRYVPLLFYVQGSVPFFYKGLGRGERPVTSEEV